MGLFHQDNVVSKLKCNLFCLFIKSWDPVVKTKNCILFIASEYIFRIGKKKNVHI